MLAKHIGLAGTLWGALLLRCAGGLVHLTGRTAALLKDRTLAPKAKRVVVLCGLARL